MVHEVSLKESDSTYLKNVTKSALTYWFIDCEYHGVTDDFKYFHFYNRSDIQHTVEALVVAGYEPVTTTTTPTTTTSTSTTTATTTSTTTTSATTTPKPMNTTPLVTAETKVVKSEDVNITNVIKTKRSVNDETTKIPHEIVYYRGSNLISSNQQFNLESPFICNRSIVPLSTNNTFGYFVKSFTVKGKFIFFFSFCTNIKYKYN